MPYNGSGIFDIGDSRHPFVPDTDATAEAFNAVLADIVDALSKVVCVDGQSTVLQNLPMNGKRITSLGSPSSITDAATLQTCLINIGKYVGTVGGTANAITLTPFPAVTTLQAGHEFMFIAQFSNTGAVTAQLSGGSAKNVTKGANVALAANDILANALIIIVYDGVQFRLK